MVVVLGPVELVGDAMVDVAVRFALRYRSVVRNGYAPCYLYLWLLSVLSRGSAIGVITERKSIPDTVSPSQYNHPSAHVASTLTDAHHGDTLPRPEIVSSGTKYR